MGITTQKPAFFYIPQQEWAVSAKLTKEIDTTARIFRGHKSYKNHRIIATVEGSLYEGEGISFEEAEERAFIKYQNFLKSIS